MDFDRFIEFVGDNAEVVAILLTVLFGALALKLLTDVIM